MVSRRTELDRTSDLVLGVGLLDLGSGTGLELFLLGWSVAMRRPGPILVESLLGWSEAMSSLSIWFGSGFDLPELLLVRLLDVE